MNIKAVARPRFCRSPIHLKLPSTSHRVHRSFHELIASSKHWTSPRRSALSAPQRIVPQATSLACARCRLYHRDAPRLECCHEPVLDVSNCPWKSRGGLQDEPRLHGCVPSQPRSTQAHQRHPARSSPRASNLVYSKAATQQTQPTQWHAQDTQGRSSARPS